MYLAAAFGLGAFHAMEPGHGKIVIAAYLVGSRGTAWQAILLGLVVAITHTASVIILGVVSLFATSLWTDFASSSIIGIVSGAAIIGIGLWMLITRWKVMSRQKKELHVHNDNTHTHNHNHNHSRLHHHHELASAQERKSLLQIFVLGISGGLVPCPAAFVVLLVSLRTGEVTSGLTYLLTFSLGVAFVLVLIGLLVCKAANIASRYFDKPGLAPMVSIASAVIITSLGGFVIWQAVAG